MQDLPQVPGGLSTDLSTLLRRIVEELRKLGGFAGTQNEMAVLWGHLQSAGLVDGTRVSTRPGSGSPPGVISVPLPDESDLTPPPSVTGLTATATFSHALVEWTAAGYTQGHGNATTRLYAAKRLTTDPPAVFANAEIVYEATHPLTVAAVPADTGLRYHFWATFVSVDGVESPTPTGGTNGVTVTIGKIDGAQHIEALTVTNALIQNLAVDNAKIANVSAAKLTAGAIGVGQYIESTNFPSGAGFRLDGGGTLTLRSGLSGARMVVSTNRIDVFDSSGVLRVRLGEL